MVKWCRMCCEKGNVNRLQSLGRCGNWGFSFPYWQASQYGLFNWTSAALKRRAETLNRWPAIMLQMRYKWQLVLGGMVPHKFPPLNTSATFMLDFPALCKSLTHSASGANNSAMCLFSRLKWVRVHLRKWWTRPLSVCTRSLEKNHINISGQGINAEILYVILWNIVNLFVIQS